MHMKAMAANVDICSVLQTTAPAFMQSCTDIGVHLRHHGRDLAPLVVSATVSASKLESANPVAVELVWPRTGLLVDASTMEFRSRSGKPATWRSVVVRPTDFSTLQYQSFTLFLSSPTESVIKTVIAQWNRLGEFSISRGRRLSVKATVVLDIA